MYRIAPLTHFSIPLTQTNKPRHFTVCVCERVCVKGVGGGRAETDGAPTLGWLPQHRRRPRAWQSCGRDPGKNVSSVTYRGVFHCQPSVIVPNHLWQLRLHCFSVLSRHHCTVKRWKITICHRSPVLPCSTCDSLQLFLRELFSNRQRTGAEWFVLLLGARGSRRVVMEELKRRHGYSLNDGVKEKLESWTPTEAWSFPHQLQTLSGLNKWMGNSFPKQKCIGFLKYVLTLTQRNTFLNTLFLNTLFQKDTWVQSWPSNWWTTTLP